MSSLQQLLPLIERTSLLRITCPRKSLRLLRESIESADIVAEKRDELEAAGVEPLVSLCREHPWNQQQIYLRPDEAKAQNKESILMNSKELVEGYFITPDNRKRQQ